MKRVYTLLILTIAFISNSAVSQNFVAGNLVVYRVGAGTAPLTSAATEVFLDEYTNAGTFVRSIPLPTTINGANRRLTASGTATSEGYLNRTTNGAYLVIPGYDAAVGTASITGSTGTTINRIVARVDYTGAINTTTALTDFASASNPRSVASANGTDLYVAGGAGGVRYATFGSVGTSTQLSTTPTNVRVVEIYDGQLYVTSGSGTTRLATVGSGLTTTSGQTITNLPGTPATGSPYGFFLADLDAGVPGVDVAYVADDAGGIIKYSLVGGTWVSNGVVAQNARGLTGSVSGSVVTLYGVTAGASAGAQTSIFSLTDPSGYNGAITAVPVILATSPANTAFRGIDFAPIQVAVLPVALNHFSVQKINNSAKVSWSTDQEINTSQFVIERSPNGRNWSEIQRLQAAGNSSRRTDYFFSDYNPLNGLNYYRLKLIDQTGKSETSIIRSVSFSKEAAMIISPNPARDFININYLKTNNGPITITLADVNGKTITQLRTIESVIKLDVRNVGKGTYLLYVTDGDRVSSEKVMIQ